jgi:hypothetical protein
MFSVLSEWLGHFSSYLVSSPIPTRANIIETIFSVVESSDAQKILKYLERVLERSNIEVSCISSSDILRLENRSRSSFRSSYTSVIDLLNHDDKALSERSQCVRLPEHTELRGFLPLVEEYEVNISIEFIFTPQISI